MGQAWCKEKSTKAQDSKSPLDRVFLRCAHRIYPGLKEEGSVLGGATQRVTSSEIGYASSPPREVLTRGQSIDSVDLPFHPSDWIDVNLEVPGTPRSTAMTNLTHDTTLYPSNNRASTNSNGSNVRDFAPIPPPRHRKKNRGRPLPPKPDQGTADNKESRDSRHEPLYSSVKPRDPIRSNKIEIYEHKVNGTGRIIPSNVVAGNRSNRDKSSRRGCDNSGHKSSRPKNSSTVSLPNYSELEISHENAQGEVAEELEIRKITAAGSLPALITSGALENIMKNDNDKRAEETVETTMDEHYEYNRSVDEVDFSFDPAKNLETLNNIYKLEGPRLTSTPVKSDFKNDSKTSTTGDGWFLHPERDERSNESEDNPMANHGEKNSAEDSQFYDCTKSSRSDTFFEAEEDQLDESKDNRVTSERAMERKSGETRKRTSLRRTLSNESEPFDSYEEKDLRESALTGLRSDSQVKLVGRSISEESLPAEMLVDETNSLVSDCSTKESNSNDKVEKKVTFEHVKKSDDTKTPPPSPEPKIKPEIFDNDHSTLLKVLRDEAEESNLSSMTPSLTELEAALSDMLEREDENDQSEKVPETEEKVLSKENTQVLKPLEEPIEPKIVQIDIDKKDRHSGVSVSLKNILGGKDDAPGKNDSIEKLEGPSRMIDIDLTNGNDNSGQHGLRNTLAELAVENTWSTAIPTTEPPEKPSRLHQVSLSESPDVSEKVPTPPRRRNRSSIGINKENLQKSLERTATPENPYPNDRLI